MEHTAPTPNASAERNAPNVPRDRRDYHRLDINLPVEILAIGGEAAPIRSTTRNIGAGGVYFEAPAGLLAPGSQVHVSLSVPPGAGYFPYAGRGTGVAEVVRFDPLTSQLPGQPRVGVAVRFSQPLKFTF